VQYLIAHHANVNIVDKYGRTALIRSSRYLDDKNPVPVMQALLDAKADPNIVSKEGSTMLDEIASQLSRETNRYQDVNKLVDDPKVSFHYRIYQWLVKRGAKLHKQSPPPDVAPGQRPR
jgi:ankyrin repeat protein